MANTGKSNAFESDILGLIFLAAAIANIADNALVTPLTNLYIALHTADPGDAGNQGTSEATYTGYARVAVARPAGWVRSGAAPTQVTNVSAIVFGASTLGTNTITHFSIGVAASGATKILYSNALTAPFVVVPLNPAPQFAAGALIVTED